MLWKVHSYVVLMVRGYVRWGSVFPLVPNGGCCRNVGYAGWLCRVCLVMTIGQVIIMGYAGRYIYCMWS